MKTPTATYVFALVAHGRRPALPRTLPQLPQGARPELLAVKPGWWLVACDVPLSTYGTESLEPRMSDLEWISAVALAHEAVVEAFLRVDALLPLKLFTIFSTPERACQHFLDREAQLADVVGRVARADEWSVRLAVRAASTRTDARPAPAVPDGGAGYLQGKKARYQAAATRQVRVRELASEIFESLSGLSSEARQRQDARTQGTLVLDAAFLVPRDGATRLKSALARHAATLKPEGVDLTVTGPWPPYSFVQD